MLSIDLKFDMYITGYRRTNPIDFGVGCIVFFPRIRKYSYILRLMKSNSLKSSSTQTVHSIELKFGMHIAGHYQTSPIDFGACWW